MSSSLFSAPPACRSVRPGVYLFPRAYLGKSSPRALISRSACLAELPQHVDLTASATRRRAHAPFHASVLSRLLEDSNSGGRAETQTSDRFAQ